jgi:hypothetical protein
MAPSPFAALRVRVTPTALPPYRRSIYRRFIHRPTADSVLTTSVPDPMVRRLPSRHLELSTMSLDPPFPGGRLCSRAGPLERIMRRFWTLASALAAAAALAGGCGDQPTFPSPTPPPPEDASGSFGLNEDDRALFKVALLFTGEQSGRALQQRAGAERIATAFAEIAGRVQADDRAGAERSIAAARQAVTRYRGLPGTAAVAPDLEAMEITLEAAAALSARDAD